MKLFIAALLGLPKTIYINFKVLKLSDAIKFPILVSHNIKIGKLKRNSIVIKCHAKFGLIKIGFGGSNAIVSTRGKICLNKNSKIIFYGRAHFAEGTIIYSNGGIIKFLNNFSCNKNCFFSINTVDSFGEDSMIGWNVSIRDSDGHKIHPVSKKNPNIYIGKHVWICSCVDILKGTKVGDNCVIGYRSCCTGDNFKSNCLIGGYPAKIIRENITWEF